MAVAGKEADMMDPMLPEVVRWGALMDMRHLMRGATFRRFRLPNPVFLKVADLMIASGLALRARYGSVVR